MPAPTCCKRLPFTPARINWRPRGWRGRGAGSNARRGGWRGRAPNEGSRRAVSCYTACQPVAFHTPPEQPNFTALPEFPTGLTPLQLSRQEMGDYALQARDLGVNYIGSCCGSVAEHVREMARVLGKLPEV